MNTKFAMKFLLPFLLIVMITSYGCHNSSRRNENADNISKIKVGMKIDDVRRIMGEPDKIEIDSFNDDEYQYIYLSPSLYSGNFQIGILRKDSSVLRIYNGL
jgi:outer membrane protein assembly factor BamE (lipoprotein component of BamABCDE complex)